MFVEVAKGSPINRGILIPHSHLPRYLQKEDAIYRSVYLYGDDAKEYVDQTGSLKNFFGLRSIDKIPIDIDKKDNSDEKTLDILRSIIYELEESGIESKSFQAFFSGSGYHLMLPNSLFEFKDSPDLPYTLKQTMKSLFPEIDLSIYMRTGIYRIQHTINQKTNLFKIPLTRDEVFNLKVSDIHKLAKTQRMDFEYHMLEGNGELKDKVITELPSIKAYKKTSEPNNIVPCIQSLLHKGPQEGSRHVTAMRIISHFKRHGMPSHYAKVVILHWNNNSMNETSLTEMVENVYNRNYRYGCQDNILSENCKTQCIYFKRKDYFVDVKDAETMQDELKSRLTTDFTGKTIDLGKMLGINKESVIYPGELVTIFGPTGSNKTTFAQNIALGVDFVNNTIQRDWQIPTLFLSLELSSWYMHRRHLQIVSGCTKEQVNNEYDAIYDKHKDDVNHISIQTISPTLELIADKVREMQPSLVIVDYIDLIDTSYSIRSEHEKVKHVSHGLSSLAVNMDLIIIQISQISREYSRNEVLDLYAGKGSGAIENASRKVIGLNGQSNDDLREVRLFKNTDGELFDTEIKWQPSFRMRRSE